MTQKAKTLRLERVFNAAPEALWNAWTDPEQYAKWLNPAGIDLVIHEWDARPGGKVRFDMPQPDGNPNPQEGVFHELDPYNRIVSGEADKSFLVQADFQPEGKRTRLIVTITGLPPEYREPATAGWNVCFDQLAQVVASDREIVISRLVNTPRERVFRAFTDPAEVGKWWGPDGFTNTIHEMDVRPGGVWRFIMHGPDGTDYPNWIRYEEVVPPERLVYEHGGGKPGDSADFRAKVTFDEEDGKTRVTLHSTFPTAAAREYVVKEYKAIEGGKQTLARLADHLEAVAKDAIS